MREIAEVDPEELVRIMGVDKEKALEIIRRAGEMVQEEDDRNRRERGCPRRSSRPDAVDQIEGVGEKTAEILRRMDSKRFRIS